MGLFLGRQLARGRFQLQLLGLREYQFFGVVAFAPSIVGWSLSSFAAPSVCNRDPGL